MSNKFDRVLAALLRDGHQQRVITDDIQAVLLARMGEGHSKEKVGITYPNLLTHLFNQTAAYRYGGLPDEDLVMPHGPLGSLFFGDDGQYRTDVDPSAVAFVRQLLGGFKRYESEPSESAIEDAKEVYLKDDRGLPHCPQPSPFGDASGGTHRLFPRLSDRVVRKATRRGLRACSTGTGGGSDDKGPESWNRLLSLLDEDLVEGGISLTGAEVLNLLTRVRQVAQFVLGRLPAFEIGELIGKHGPGAVVGEKDKFAFQSWHQRLDEVFPWSHFGVPNPEWCQGEADSIPIPSDEDEPCRIAFVPKTVKGPRTIAIEPACNQFCQQAIWLWLKEHIPAATFGMVNFTSQAQNQEAARQASLTGAQATVDLSSASDLISLDLVTFLFQSRPDLLEAMMACRSEQVDLGDGRIHRLRKYASMGNATTFPVESLVFFILCIGCCLYESGGKANAKTISRLADGITVFGDDIVLPVSAYTLFREVCQLLGMRLNFAKSYAAGPFRESCGLDAWAGVDVTPTYIRSLSSSSARGELACLAAANGLWKGGWWHTSTCVAGFLSHRWLHTVDPEAIPGLLTFTGVGSHRHRKRWNPRLQREEWLVPSVRVKARTVKTSGTSRLMRYLSTSALASEGNLPHLKGVVSAEDRLAQATKTDKIDIRSSWKWIAEGGSKTA